MSTWIQKGSPDLEISLAETEQLMTELVRQLPTPKKKALIIPPDFSRFHSGAGEISACLYRLLSASAHVDLLPALGTHRPMTPVEMNTMFPGVPHACIKVHDWQKGLVQLGEIPGQRLKELSEGKVNYAVKIEIDRIIDKGGYDTILSCGQIVPHEVIGMAGGNKNLLVGCGGPDIINKSHFLGGVCNMETIMGHIESPVRSLFNEAEDRFFKHLPLHYILTVRSKNAAGALVTRGLFAGNDRDSYLKAARLSQQVNVIKVPPLKKVVVWLDPGEFKSTWLGNKAIYRTRMAIATGGELLILAPGLVEFGEAEVNERMIRKYGYHGTPFTLKAVAENQELRDSLGAAAHLIHGSSEGRFTITYASGGLTRSEIEAVGFQFTDLKAAMARYNPERLKDGFNTMPDGEQIFFISNPALGLWQRE